MWIERPAWAGHKIEAIGQPGGKTLNACPGDHRAIVGAEPQWRRDEAHIPVVGELFEHFAYRHIGCDASGHNECSGWVDTV